MLLAGDAAHVHSPAGGQGMNTGVRDAVTLAAALTALVRGEADASVLDAYERQRRPVAQRVLAMTDRLTRVATVRHPALRRARNGLLAALAHAPVLPRQFAAELAGIRRRDGVDATAAPVAGRLALSE